MAGNATKFDDTTTEINATLELVNGDLSMRRILQAVRPEVELILDVQAPTDWSFSTHPGAIRRIVLNLFGRMQQFALGN